MARGKAEPGDKTMYDALAPALAAFDAALGPAPTSAPRRRPPPTRPRRAATRPSRMLALKGRASYLGERSVGHIDPGAASAALLLAALADAVG